MYTVYILGLGRIPKIAIIRPDLRQFNLFFLFNKKNHFKHIDKKKYLPQYPVIW